MELIFSPVPLYRDDVPYITEVRYQYIKMLDLRGALSCIVRLGEIYLVLTLFLRHGCYICAQTIPGLFQAARRISED